MQIFAGQLISHNNAANFLHAAAGHNWMRCWWYNGAKQSTLLHIWNQSEFYLPKTDAYVCAVGDAWSKVQISVNIWSKVQTNSHKYLWIFGRGEAKHRHHKARANTLFVIGRNIDGSVMDLRRFYLIISRVQTIPLWSKTTSMVTSVSTCCFWNWKKHQQSHNGSRPMCLMKIELETKVWTKGLCFSSQWFSSFPPDGGL